MEVFYPLLLYEVKTEHVLDIYIVTFSKVKQILKLNKNKVKFITHDDIQQIKTSSK